MTEAFEGWIALPDVGRAYLLSPTLLYRLAQLGQLGEVKKFGGRLFVRVTAVERWRRVQQREAQAAATTR